jgi:hypothetical protein
MAGSKLAARAAGANTTIAIVATDAALTRAEASRIAIMAHDGMARAVRPVHTPFDGDTVFALATGAVDPGDNRPQRSPCSVRSPQIAWPVPLAAPLRKPQLCMAWLPGRNHQSLHDHFASNCACVCGGNGLNTPRPERVTALVLHR